MQVCKMHYCLWTATDLSLNMILTAPMNIYFYAAGNPGYAGKLLEIIDGILDTWRIIPLPDHFPASVFLDYDMHSGDVLILIPNQREQLDHLLKMKELLQDFRLILILPDSAEETVTRGHLLMPRFLTFTDNDMDEVLHVLGRMSAR